MRTQKELKEYYKRTDRYYKGENPPSGWRFVDPEKEKIPYKHLNSCDGEWFSLENNDDLKYSLKQKWVLITDLPLPDFAPEKTIQSDQTSKSKQVEQPNQNSQTQTSQLMNERKYIVGYGPVNYEVPETTLKEIFKPDAYNRLYSFFKSPFQIVSEFLSNGSLSCKDAEIKVQRISSNGSNCLVTPDDSKYFYFPPPYLKTVKFVYRKNRDEINWRTLGVTEETETYISGIDLADDQFKKFLKEKILGGEVIEVANQS